MTSILRSTRRALLIPVVLVAAAACGDESDPVVPEITADIIDIATSTADVSTLAAAIEAAGLVDALRGSGPFTVFAPVNSAFATLGDDVVQNLLDPANVDLLTSILTFHVVSGAAVTAGELSDGQTLSTIQGESLTIALDGDGVTVNGIQVISADIQASNGVIHLIDGVLLPELDIVDQAALNGFSTLVGAVQGAGLEATLRGDNGGAGFTVFAPTNEAFAALAEIPSGDGLVSVLTYHVVGATVGSADLSDGQMVTTVEGTPFTVNIGMDGVSLTDATGQTVRVLLTDVPAANGVIHVIDGVILPAG